MKYSNLIPESFFTGDMPLLEFNPDKVPPAQRQLEKFRTEMERFDEERYANDNYDQETLAGINAAMGDGNLSDYIEKLKEKSISMSLQ